MATNSQRISNLETQVNKHKNVIQQLQIQLQESVNNLKQGFEKKLEGMMERFEALLYVRLQSLHTNAGNSSNQTKIEDPSSLVNQVCVESIQDKVISVLKSDSSSPRLTDNSTIVAFCTNIKACPVVDKVFNKNPQRESVQLKQVTRENMEHETKLFDKKLEPGITIHQNEIKGDGVTIEGVFDPGGKMKSCFSCKKENEVEKPSSSLVNHVYSMKYTSAMDYSGAWVSYGSSELALVTLGYMSTSIICFSIPLLAKLSLAVIRPIPISVLAIEKLLYESKFELQLAMSSIVASQSRVSSEEIKSQNYRTTFLHALRYEFDDCDYISSAEFNVKYDPGWFLEDIIQNLWLDLYVLSNIFQIGYNHSKGSVGYGGILHGSFLTGCFVEHNVVDIQFWTNSNVSSKNTLMLGAGYYEMAGYHIKNGYGFMTKCIPSGTILYSLYLVPHVHLLYEFKLIADTCCEKLGMEKFGEQVIPITMFDPQLKIAILLIGMQFGGKGHPPNFCVSGKQVFITMSFGCNFYILNFLINFYGGVGSDEKAKIQVHTVYEIDVVRVYSNHMVVAYTKDAQGDELFPVYIIDNDASTTIGKLLVGVTYSIEWAEDVLMHIIMDKTLQQEKVWLLQLGTNESSESYFLQEDDDILTLHLAVFESKDGKSATINSICDQSKYNTDASSVGLHVGTISLTNFAQMYASLLGVHKAKMMGPLIFLIAVVKEVLYNAFKDTFYKSKELLLINVENEFLIFFMCDMQCCLRHMDI